MTYLALALAVLLIAQHHLHTRECRRLEAKRDWERQRADQQNKAMLDQIILLKVSPTTAAVVATPEVEDQYLPLSDDEAVAEYELERKRESD